MSFEIKKHRERITDACYAINKEEDKILFLKENLESRLKSKENCLKNKLKWEHVYQLGLEQTECEIKVCEAVRDKLINEVKFLRLILVELKEKLNN